MLANVGTENTNVAPIVIFTTHEVTASTKNPTQTQSYPFLPGRESTMDGAGHVAPRFWEAVKNICWVGGVEERFYCCCDK